MRSRQIQQIQGFKSWYRTFLSVPLWEDFWPNELSSLTFKFNLPLLQKSLKITTYENTKSLLCCDVLLFIIQIRTEVGAFCIFFVQVFFLSYPFLKGVNYSVFESVSSSKLTFFFLISDSNPLFINSEMCYPAVINAKEDIFCANLYCTISCNI